MSLDPHKEYCLDNIDKFTNFINFLCVFEEENIQIWTAVFMCFSAI